MNPSDQAADTRLNNRLINGRRLQNEQMHSQMHTDHVLSTALRATFLISRLGTQPAVSSMLTVAAKLILQLLTQKRLAEGRPLMTCDRDETISAPVNTHLNGCVCVCVFVMLTPSQGLKLLT